MNRIFAAALLLLGAAIALAGSIEPGARGLLGGLVPASEGLAALGEALGRGGHALVAPLRWPALLVLVLLRPWRRRERALPAALVLALIAQSFLLGAEPWAVPAGLTAYAAASLLWWRGPAPSRDAKPAQRIGGLEVAALGTATLLYLALALVGLDLHPDVHLDEIAYLRAAEMLSGAIPRAALLPPPFEHLYRIERFAAQPLALWSQRLAIECFGERLLATRLSAVASVGAAGWIAWRALRPRIGAFGAFGIFAGGLVLPLGFYAARRGLYLSFSLVHAALVLAWTLELIDRAGAWRALRLGALLGASLYLYQLSWFTPLLAGALLCADARCRSAHFALRSGLPLLLAALGVAAGVVRLPESGLAQLHEQTFAWQTQDGDSGASGGVALRFADAVDAQQAEALRERLFASGLRSWRYAGPGGQRVLSIAGSSEAAETALAGLDPATVRPLLPAHASGPLAKAGALIAQLFRGPGWGDAYRMLVDGPALNPLLAPLLLLGLVEGLRRRRDPALRSLALWCALGGILPSLVSDVHPRRSLLAFPFVCALAACAVQRALGPSSAAGRGPFALRCAALGLAWCAALATGWNQVLYRYDVPLEWIGDFASEDGRAAARRQPVLERVDRLNLARILRHEPAESAWLLPPGLPRVAFYLGEVEGIEVAGERARVLEIDLARSAAGLRQVACRRNGPSTWLLPDRAEYRERFAGFERDFVLRREKLGGFLRIDLEPRREPACADAAATP